VRPSLRFLALAVLGWAGFRAAILGVLPGADMFQIDRSEAKAPPIVATQFPAIEPVQPATPLLPAADPTTAEPPVAQAGLPVGHYVQGAIGVPVALRPGVVAVYQLPPVSNDHPADLPQPTRTQGSLREFKLADYPVLPPLGEGPLSLVGNLSSPVSRPAGAIVGQSVPVLEVKRLDRWQLSSWALLRSQQTGIAGSQSLATAGQLGASQAGARVIYNLTRQFALAARTSSEVGRRGGEVAAGVRIQPLAHIPIWLTAERRLAIGRYGGGRNAFALFAEGGVYGMPLPWRFSMDSYLQGGIVGARKRDLFIDGGLAVTRPVYSRFSAGFGIWGAAQPGLYRVDAGPRITLRVRRNLKVHFDWRQRLKGNARPGSGPAVTLSGDF
jgi:hypothetical protein